MNLYSMPLHIGDYFRETRHLTTEQHGAYLLLIFEYWSKGCLPDDEAQLARIAGFSAAKWRANKPVIQAFFHDGWHHERIDDELSKARNLANKRRDAANARWQKDQGASHLQ
jgi:uncharacterized protein YdaU (DUF1376 family)